MQIKIKIVLQVLFALDVASYNYKDVVMVVPEKREEASIWTIVKPFDSGLWCTTAGVMIYTVFVVWLLERKNNSQSSTEVFTHIWSTVINMSLSSFNIQNRLARTVASIWLLVMSVIMVSYITNYVAMLNVQKVDVNEILASDGAIGYLKLHLSKSYLDWFEKLKAYTTEEECAQALSQGPNRGGVGVIFMDRLDALHFISRRPGYTYYDIPPEADTPSSLGVKDFLVWFVITGTASTLGLIKFIFDLLYTCMRPPTALSATLPHRDLQEIAVIGRLAPVTDTSEMVLQSDSPESSLVRRIAPITERERERRVATSSPFAEDNASPGDDDEDDDRNDDDDQDDDSALIAAQTLSYSRESTLVRRITPITGEPKLIHWKWYRRVIPGKAV